MQIMRTEVAEATSPAGRLIQRVRFCGEGDECVTVEMACLEGSAADDAAALQRARAILVQTATFDAASNAYDAQSNGNFDELAVTLLNDESGGIYVFEYRDGEGSRQVPPVSMPSLEAAREEAVRSAIDVLVDLQPGTDDLSGWLVRVRDENGGLLCAIDVAEAEAALQIRSTTGP